MLTSSKRTCEAMNQLWECIAVEIQWSRLYAKKENLTQISKKFNCDIRVVRDVRNRINSNSCITNSYKKDKKSKIPDAIKKFIESVTIANRTISSSAIADLIFQSYHVSVSKSLVNCIRHQIGFIYSEQIRSFPLTDEQKAKRLQFAQNNRENDFANVLFTDESYFELNGRRWIWRRKGEITNSIIYKQEAHPIKLMVWGGVSLKYKANLIIFEKGETMNSSNYVKKVLKGAQFWDQMDALYPEGWVYMHDNAPPHVASKTNEYIESVNWVVLDWPPHSPDLNIIEHIWAWMKRKVSELNPQSVDDLVMILNDVWNSIDQNYINNLVSSMPKRLKYVIENNGGQIIGHL